MAFLLPAREIEESATRLRPADRERDLELVEAARRGDDRAFETLVSESKRRLASVAVNILRDSDEAQDAVQEAFVAAYRNLGSFRGDSAFSTWATRICVRECLDRIRSRQVRERFRLAWPFGARREEAEASTMPEFTDHALRSRIDSALRRLPARQRTIVVLRVFEEMTVPEIADAVGVAPGTVKAHLFRATRSLRTWLGDLK